MEEAGKEMDAAESRLFALCCLSDPCVDLAVCLGLRLSGSYHPQQFAYVGSFPRGILGVFQQTIKETRKGLFKES